LTNSKKIPSELDRHLARYLLSTQEGNQILSTRELAESFGVSIGSISSALNDLEENHAITLNRRGRLGSFLEQRSIGALWNIVENGPMVIALTLPSYPKSEGLATAIYSLLNAAGIETYLTFLRGSFNRLKTLRGDHCHAVVVSALAADELSGVSEKVVLKLPPQSYLIDHRVFCRKTAPTDSKPLAVGVDHDSFDLKYLTELEFEGQDVVFHQMTYTQIDSNLEQSFVDAAISNVDHLERLISNEITSRPLSLSVQSRVGDRATSAVILVRAESDATAIVLREILQGEAILEIQQKVIDGLIVPRY
jgi:DNA-binding transcriptional ArsR family regulator